MSTKALMTSTRAIPRDPDGDFVEPPWIAGLVASARLGNEQAFGRLYGEFAPRVYRFCWFRVAQAADAEDLTQQTFMKAVEALPRYEDRGLPFAAWLFRIARNVVIDFERGCRTDLDIDDITDWVGGPIADPEITGADDRDALLRALAELTSVQRDVLTYRFFADLSARDTGLLMGRNEATVRALQARAIRALRRRLAHERAPDPEPTEPRPSDRPVRGYILHPAGQRP